MNIKNFTHFSDDNLILPHSTNTKISINHVFAYASQYQKLKVIMLRFCQVIANQREKNSE